MKFARLLLRHLPPSLRTDEAAVAGAAFLSFAVTILWSRGIPYGLDGNETFSSIVHAINLVNFDFSHAKGLADETLSREVAAHSFVHTHQGNFPRIFATVLYVFGIRSPEGQVVATALLIGVPSVVLWYRFVSSLLGKLGALISVGFILTDYALFLQTQLVTYRTWHFFFLASTFYCVHRLSETKHVKWQLALLCLFFCIFYYELLFATFLASAIGLLALWYLKDEPKVALLTVAACGVGTTLGFSVFVLQAAALLGWQGMVHDLFGTVLARNSAESVALQLDQLKSFADANGIVFFMNLVDGNTYRSMDWVVQTFTKYGLLGYSPLVFVLVIQWAAGALVAELGADGWLRAVEHYPVAWLAAAITLTGIRGTYACLLVGFVLFAWCAWMSKRAGGFKTDGWAASWPHTAGPWICWFLALLTLEKSGGSVVGSFFDRQAFFALLLATVLGLLSAIFLPLSVGNGALRAYATGRTQVLLLSFIGAIGLASIHSDTVSLAYWPTVVGGAYLGVFNTKLLLGCNALAVVALVATVPCKSMGVAALPRRDHTSLKLFLLFSLSALIVVNLLLPGYMFSGYLVRYCVFIAPIFGLVAGYGLSWFLQTSRASLILANSQRVQVLGRSSLGIAGLAVVVWFVIQADVFRRIPPDEFARLIAALRSIPGASIAANTYAAPFYVATGANVHDGWAYSDSRIGRAEVQQTDDGYDYVRDTTYLWFADRLTNTKYKQPSVYVCLHSRYFSEGMYERLVGIKTASCKSERMIELALVGNPVGFPQPKLIAADRTGGDRWAVVAIDYDFPPFLKEMPKLTSIRRSGELELNVEYLYHHQANVSEGETIIRVFALNSLDPKCADKARLIATEGAHGGIARVQVPLSQILDAEAIVVGVEPRTVTRRGAEMYSEPLHLDRGATVYSKINCNNSP